MANLIGDIQRYMEETEKGELPKGLEKFKHSRESLINPNTPNVKILFFYNSEFYCSITDSLERHVGVDIQLNEGTIVHMPEKAQVIHFKPDVYVSYLARVLFYAPESRVAYIVGHLKKCSVPEKIAEKEKPDILSKTYVEKGEPIGEVGVWPYELTRGSGMPDDVKSVCEGSCNHLHVQTHHYPRKWMFWLDYCRCREELVLNHFNPLLLFKRLDV
jgi:hypothetical protein